MEASIVERQGCFGVFYNWIDCSRSVANLPEEEFSGYQTMTEAYEAFDRGYL